MLVAGRKGSKSGERGLAHSNTQMIRAGSSRRETKLAKNSEQKPKGRGSCTASSRRKLLQSSKHAPTQSSSQNKLVSAATCSSAGAAGSLTGVLLGAGASLQKSTLGSCDRAGGSTVASIGSSAAVPRGKKSAGSQSQLSYGSLGRPIAKEPALMRKATLQERGKKSEGKAPGDYF